MVWRTIILGAESHLSPEEFIGYIVIFSQIIPPVKSFTSAFYHIQKGSASAKRVCEILDEENTIKDPVHPKGKAVLQNCINFKMYPLATNKKRC